MSTRSWLLLLASLTGLASVISLLAGHDAASSIAALLQLPGHDPLQRTLLLELRLPRVVSAAAAGALLACAGLAIQARFHNDLAEPGLIGISGGGALAAALALAAAWPAQLVSVAAFAGATLALLAIQTLAHGRAAAKLLLAGVAVNALCGSLLTLLITTLPDGGLRNVTFWLMGSFAGASGSQAMLLLAAAGLIAWRLWRQAPFLQALQLGDRAAFYGGFNVGREGWHTVLLATLACGLVVAQCGMVGFIGLMAPHILRRLIGLQLRPLLLLTPLAGALLAVLADLIASQALYPAELPVGVITSLAGAPFFLYLLARQRGAHA
ncbi:FecCD family ABC transporter permease [Vogesella facilis]|uniref:FecCD family ABC transporter permease n=1 Tax=Vogesella facilis TaxID=1655232 RepID=A0ABV7RIW1_9NEIS